MIMEARFARGLHDAGLLSEVGRGGAVVDSTFALPPVPAYNLRCRYPFGVEFHGRRAPNG